MDDGTQGHAVEFGRIVTHGDFDGVVSAALCSYAFSCDRFVFTGPNAVTRADISIGPAEIVCDLPYPLECGMWFDHHPGNIEALRLRGIDPATIPGRFDERPSCARVVLDFLEARGDAVPERFIATVAEADVIDSFDYRSVEEWRRETPGKLVDMSLKVYFPSPRDQTKYLGHLTALVRDLPLVEALGDGQVASNIERYRIEEERMVEFVAKSVTFLPEDAAGELVVMDFTPHNRRPRVIRNLAYLLHPRALGALTITPIFSGGRKTNDFSVSISLSMNLTGVEHGKDMGEIMRTLGIGDGHVGAAAGTVHCGSKDEMLRTKARILGGIWKLWRSMQAGGGR